MTRLRKSGWLSLCLAIVCCGAVLSGCASKPNLQLVAEKKAPVRLTFFGFKTGATKVEEIERILNAYMAQHPNVVITYEGISNDYVDILTQRLQSNNADDIFMISPSAFSTYAERGWIGSKIVDLSDRDFIRRFNPHMQRLITINGQIPGAPLCMSVVGLMANMDLLRACGIDEVPQTYSDWIASMETIRAQGRMPLLSYLGNDASPMFLAAGRAFAPSLRPGASSQVPDKANFYAGLSDIAQLMRAGLIDRAQLLEATDSRSYQKVLGGAFAAGKAAYAIVPSWGLNAFLSAKPAFSYRYCGLPLTEDGPIAAIRASVPVGVNNESPHKEEALAFLEFLMRPEHIETYAADQYSLSPLRGAHTANPLFSELLQLAEANKTFSDADPRISFNVPEALNHASAVLAAGGSLEEAARHLPH